LNLWGIDLGGTKIEGVILDGSNPTKALHRLRLPTEGDKGYEHVMGQIRRVIEELEKTSGQKRGARIGFGTPGAIEPATGFLKNSNTLCLNGHSLREDLSAMLGVDATVANDANCCALAEATLGAAKDASSMVGLIMGTGCGSGVVINKQLVVGLHGIGGEWGHNLMRDENTPCYCGKGGCVETVIAGPSLERWFRERTGNALRLPEIVRLSKEGNPDAVATLDRLSEKFAEAIAVLINIIDPHAIVIGGGVGNLDTLYSPETRARIAKYVFNNDVRTPLLRPALGDSTGVFGAAMLIA
jgi:predicted NBD/HSP70 family sugar kinase